MTGPGTDGAGQLAPGVTRLRPDDHFMVLLDTDATPTHLGALVVLGPGGGDRGSLADALRSQVGGRLAATPLPVTLHQSPGGYDSDVWVDTAGPEVSARVVTVDDDLDDAGLDAFVAARSAERLDLALPPFRVFLLPGAGAHGALFVQVHHAVTDGVGFQNLLGRLSDDVPASAAARPSGVLPPEGEWMRLAEERFAAQAAWRDAHRERAREALAVLRGGTVPDRPTTPTLRMSGPTAPQRAYTRLSVPLARVRALAGALGGTVNDVFLAVTATALRRYLLDVDDLPDLPLVANSARSYRREDHGPYGNRIVAIHPHLATDVADPLRRFRAIQASMAAERLRSPLDEALLNAPERPWGARDRRDRAAARAPGASLLPGNVTLSNVPGPAATRRFAGRPQLANYPAPLLGGGRFLNVTSRRNGGTLDLGIMVDPTRIPDPTVVAAGIAEAVAEYEAATR